MTPADTLRAHADALEREAASRATALRRLADSLDGAPIAMPPHVEWIDTGRAAKLTGAARSTLKAWARKFGVGEQTPTGAWRYNKSALLALTVPGCAKSANRSNRHLPEDGDAAHVDREETT